MQFFDNGRNQFYPADAIDRMTKSYQLRGGDEVAARIYLKSDPDHGIEVSDYTIDQIMRAVQQVIPAQPGFRLLTFGFDASCPDEGEWVSDEPILGWRVDAYGTMEPAVFDYNFSEMTGEHAILEPSGKVHVVDAVYDDIESWKRDLKATALRRHEMEQSRQVKDGVAKAVSRET